MCAARRAGPHLRPGRVAIEDRRNFRDIHKWPIIDEANRNVGVGDHDHIRATVAQFPEIRNQRVDLRWLEDRAEGRHRPFSLGQNLT